ncbi:MAG: methyltransferase domain-containing protein [Gammaproteobacteria bacterium]|nr:class I SAM-dependent methyltransferase [Gammaproteobacteria bacterium]NIP88701.1 class I SAM-dependent methyltransferase [Gammaproteobacteria bacterium]NIR23423.1 class I SAM-dependent methyltransferase [Gammaproteobacteria bacterium]NIS04993.1 class I SAM-dependent methyltransferase [Gammaproteobacteria bacterium]NIU40272.1 methyltransferase domain-containing protein [Gammaproteobacteria bacterium]
MSEHDDTPSNYASNVRAQYEAYPFPLRDPRDEAKRLVVAEQECLGKLNHFCFGGRQSFGDGFRVLVAGGGTGDHTIFLAEQLRDYDASVTYVDISRSSMAIAQARARARGLKNIEWHHSSILDLASLNPAPFDLVSCTGVLHHLPEPERGIDALRRVLAPQGAMSLMLYGRTGRLPVYAGQELMRLVNSGVDDAALKIRNARATVQALPDTNWLLRGQDAKGIVRNFLEDESNLYDVLIHEQDRAYSVPEIYDFLAGADLELIEFTSFHSDPPCFRYMYDPMPWITDSALASHVAKLPRATQQAIAEAIHCMLTCHAFYAAPGSEDRIASPEDLEMVPFFLYFDSSSLAQHFRGASGRECGLNYRQSTVHFEVGKYSAPMMAAIDGSRSLAEMIDMVRAETGGVATKSELLEDFMAFYRPLNCLDILLLRHRSVAPFREYPLEVVA